MLAAAPAAGCQLLTHRAPATDPQLVTKRGSALFPIMDIVATDEGREILTASGSCGMWAPLVRCGGFPIRRVSVADCARASLRAHGDRGDGGPMLGSIECRIEAVEDWLPSP